MKGIEWISYGIRREEPAPHTTTADKRLQRQADDSRRFHERLAIADPEPAEPVELPQVQGLQELADHQHRIAANLAEIDAEEQADHADVEQRKTELTAEAAQAILAGRSAESEPFAKVQEEFARRHENRRLRRQALADAKVTVDVAVRTQLVHAVRGFFAQMRQRTAALVAEQAEALRAFRAARTEEQALQRQALREVGRVHKMLPALAAGASASSADPDQRLLDAFLDGNIGVPKLNTSGRQILRDAALEQWLESAKKEGHHAD